MPACGKSDKHETRKDNATPYGRDGGTAGFDGANGTMWRVYVDNLVQYADKMLRKSEGQNEVGYDVHLSGGRTTTRATVGR